MIHCCRSRSSSLPSGRWQGGPSGRPSRRNFVETPGVSEIQEVLGAPFRVPHHDSQHPRERQRTLAGKPAVRHHILSAPLEAPTHIAQSAMVLGSSGESITGITTATHRLIAWGTGVSAPPVSLVWSKGPSFSLCCRRHHGRQFRMRCILRCGLKSRGGSVSSLPCPIREPHFRVQLGLATRRVLSGPSVPSTELAGHASCAAWASRRLLPAARLRSQVHAVLPEGHPVAALPGTGHRHEARWWRSGRWHGRGFPVCPPLVLDSRSYGGSCLQFERFSTYGHP